MTNQATIDVFGRLLLAWEKDAYMPRFRLSSLFLAMGFAAVAMGALARPSIYWALTVPAAMSLLYVVAIHKCIALPHVRAFWASLVAGQSVYLLLVLVVRQFFMYDGSWDVWQVYLGTPAWKIIHGNVPLTSIINGYSRFDFIGFTVSLHVVCAILISWTAAVIFHNLHANRPKSI